MYEITLKFCGLCHVSLELLLGGSIIGADRYVFEAKFCDFPCNHIISMNCLLAFLLENEPEFSFVCRDIKIPHRLHILLGAFRSHHGDYRP